MKPILATVLLVVCCSAVSASPSGLKQFFIKGKSGLCLAVKGPTFQDITMAECEVSPSFIVNLGPNGRNIVFPMLDSNTVRCVHVENPENIERLPQAVTTNNCDQITFWASVFTATGQKFVLMKNAFDQALNAPCLEEQVGASPIVVNSCDDSKPEQRWTLIEAVVP
jgi:hypothetical protein